MKKQLLKLTILFALFLPTKTVNAATWYVSTTGGVTVGNTWATATNNLQAAITAASAGDQVWVAAGTYMMGSIITMKDGVAIYGGFAGNEITLSQRNWVTHATIINGSINGHTVIFNNSTNNLTSTAILDGFFITGADNSYTANGGAIFNYNSSPTITNIIFSGNTATYGGAIYNYNSSPTISNVIFSGNTATAYGGGMYNNNSSSPKISNVIFNGNNATYGGGGMENNSSSPTITNVIFSGNTATNYGGGMYNYISSSPTITNVTFSGNNATYGGGMYSDNNSLPTIKNCILWGNSSEIVDNSGAASTVYYSIVQGGWGGAGNNNSSANPLFVNASNAIGADNIWFTSDDGLRLQPTSTAINAGSNALIPSGITTDIAGAARIQFGTVDMGAYEYAPPPASSLNFDGTNDYVNCGSALTSTLSNSNKITVEAWVKPSTNTGNSCIVGNYATGVSNLQFLLRRDGANYSFWTNDGSGFVSLFSAATVSTNVWQHIAGTWDGATMKIYVNGTLSGSVARVGTNLNPSTGPVWIGGNSGGENLNGTIDEVRIWNRALCQGEILNNMNGEIASSSSGLLANYHFNQGLEGIANPTVTTLTDVSGNGNNGTLTNIALTGTVSNWVNPGAVTSGSTVTAFVSPTVSITGATSICSGATTTLTASGNVSSFAWSSGPNTSVYTVSPATTMSYSVVGTNSLGCVSNTAIKTITVNTLPIINVNSGSICSGKSFTIIPSGAVTYTYSSGSSVVNPTSNTSYSVTGASAQGCTNTAVSSVSVNALPTVTVNSGAICSGQSFTITASGASTYTYSSGSSVVNPTSNTSYSVTGTSAQGCTNTAVSSVTVNALPTVTVNSGAICSGKTFTLVPGGASTYTYSSGSSVVNPTSNTSYSVTGTSAQGCVSSNTAVSEVTVNALPTVTVNSGAICSGNSFTISPSGASTYTYSGGSSVVSPTANTSYNITGASAFGCTNTAISSVTVNPLPTLTASSNTICAGQLVTYSATGGTNYDFQINGITVQTGTLSTFTTNTISNGNIVSVLVGSATSGTTTLYSQDFEGVHGWTLNTPTGTQGPDPNFWTVNDNEGGVLPSGCGVNSNGNKTLHITSVIFPTGGANYDAGGFCGMLFCPMANTRAESPNISTIGHSNMTLKFDFIANGDALNDNASVVYFDGTSWLTLVNSIKSPVCGGGQGLWTSFSAPLPAGFEGKSNAKIGFIWVNNDDGIGTDPSVAINNIKIEEASVAIACSSPSITMVVNPTPTITVNSGSFCSGNSFTISPNGASTYTYSGGSSVVSPTATASYSITGASAFGCTNTAVSSVTVNSVPTITVNSGAICSGNSFTISPSGASTYTFSGGSSVVNPTATASFTITGASALGCTNAAVSTVTVNALPIITVNSGAICLGQSFTMTASGASTYTYSSGSSVVNPTSNTSYSVTGTSAQGCVSSNTAVSSVTVNALPTVTAMSSNTLVCAGNNTSLTATGASSYTWNGGATTSVISVTPSITTTYTVNGIDANGCSNIATVTQSVSICTEINQSLNINSQIFIYPNPSTGYITVITPDNATSLIITDILGNELVSIRPISTNTLIDLNHQANGVYFIKVSVNSLQSVHRIILNK